MRYNTTQHNTTQYSKHNKTVYNTQHNTTQYTILLMKLVLSLLCPLLTWPIISIAFNSLGTCIDTEQSKLSTQSRRGNKLVYADIPLKQSHETRAQHWNVTTHDMTFSCHIRSSYPPEMTNSAPTRVGIILLGTRGSSLFVGESLSVMLPNYVREIIPPPHPPLPRKCKK